MWCVRLDTLNGKDPITMIFQKCFQRVPLKLVPLNFDPLFHCVMLLKKTFCDHILHRPRLTLMSGSWWLFYIGIWHITVVSSVVCTYKKNYARVIGIFFRNIFPEFFQKISVSYGVVWCGVKWCWVSVTTLESLCTSIIVTDSIRYIVYILVFSSI